MKKHRNRKTKVTSRRAKNRIARSRLGKTDTSLPALVALASKTIAIRRRRRASNVRCYIFDIDGTLADCSHRLHHIKGEKKDWRAFFAACHDDVPIPHILELAHALSARAPIICVSGRSDEVLGKTKRWLGEQFIVCQQLYMRKAGDRRPDDIVKAEILSQILADGWEPIMAFDDRDRVVKMWRAKGIPCCQVADGDF